MNSLESGVQAFKEKDYEQTLSLLKPYADKGEAEAQCIIANLYHLGLGVKRDVAEAIKWYVKSAKQGYPIASNNLGCIYLIADDGVPQDLQAAAQWYRLSRKQGFLREEAN